jgi:hypothetical protein
MAGRYGLVYQPAFEHDGMMMTLSEKICACGI